MLRRTYFAAGTIFGIILLAQLTLFLANLRTRDRAESLLTTVRRFKLDTSTLKDLQPILYAYHAQKISPSSNCPSADASYGVVISNAIINRIGQSHPTLLRVGVRPVSTTLALSFTRGRLCEFRFSESALISPFQFPLRDVDPNSAKLVEIRTETAMQAFDDAGSQMSEHYAIKGYDALLRGATASGRTLAVEAIVTPDASTSAIQSALGFDLSCFTSLSGCRLHCQMLPAVFRDAARNLRPSIPFVTQESEYKGCRVLIQ